MNQVPEGYFALIGNYYVDSINQYHLLKNTQNIKGKTIGRGTFGKVKMGLHTLTMQNVAIKILDKDKIIDESDKVRVAREIQILRKIRHPNIIQLYEIIESQTQLFLITEYAPNSELFDYIVQRNKLNERQSARFLLQILSAIEYLHQNNIVHRDLKPENLLLDFNDSIKVVDFGLSNMYENGETLKTACGSPCYAAPEMVSGKRYEGLKTDIWSCGIILFAMICGYLPFEDTNTTDLYKKIINDPAKLPKFLTERSKSILNGILEKDPSKRLTIEQIRKHEFCVLNSNQPILKGITFGQDEILVDPLILQIVKEQYGIDPEQAKVMVQNNKHNQITATYYLLLNSHIRNGGISIADLNRQQNQKQATPKLSTNKLKELKYQTVESDNKNNNNIELQNNNNNLHKEDIYNNQEPKKPQIQNFQQIMSDQLNQQNSEKKEQYEDSSEKQREINQKNSSGLSSSEIESPIKSKDEQRVSLKNRLIDESSPAIIVQQKKQKLEQKRQISQDQQKQISQEQDNQSPNFSPILQNKQSLTQSSTNQQNKRNKIDLIKNLNLEKNETTSQKQNFFQEEEIQNKASLNKQVQSNIQQNKTDQEKQNSVKIQNQKFSQQISNKLFGGTFRLDQNGSPTRIANIPYIDKKQIIEKQLVQQKSNSKSNNQLKNLNEIEQIILSNNKDDDNIDNFTKAQKSECESATLCAGQIEKYKIDLSIKKLQSQIRNTRNGNDQSDLSKKINLQYNNLLKNKQNNSINFQNNSLNYNNSLIQQNNTSLSQIKNQQDHNLLQQNNESQQNNNSNSQNYNFLVNGSVQNQHLQSRENNNSISAQQNLFAPKQQNRTRLSNDKNNMSLRKGNSKDKIIDTNLNKSDNLSKVSFQNNFIANSIQKQDLTTQNYKQIQRANDDQKNLSQHDNVSLQHLGNQQNDFKNQQNQTSNKNGSKLVVKIHQKTKSDSGLSRKIMNLSSTNQKEIINQTDIDQTIASPEKEKNMTNINQNASTNNQVKSNNEKIQNLISQVSKKGSLNTQQNSNPWKQYLPNFFNNQSYLTSNPQGVQNNTMGYLINSSLNNNISKDNQYQANLSSNNYSSKLSQKTPAVTEPVFQQESSSIRMKLKQISQRQSAISNSSSLFKVRVRKSATPEFNNVTNNQFFNKQQQNTDSQQPRNNINNNISLSNQISQSLSPDKRVGSQKITRQSRRIISADRENSTFQYQNTSNDSAKNRFFRNDSNSTIKKKQTISNKLDSFSSPNKQGNSSKSGDSAQQNEKKGSDNQNLILLVKKEVIQPKVRIISESPMNKKDQYGLKQQMIQKEPFICNFNVNNDSNIHHQQTNNDVINSTIEDITSQKINNQKLSNLPHSNSGLNTNSQNKQNLNNISNSSRVSTNNNDQIIQPQQMTNSQSEQLKLKGVTNQLVNNSYSLVNISKYKVRKSKINNGMNNISNIQ